MQTIFNDGRKASSMIEQQNDKVTANAYPFPWKEFAVYVPIVCSALALTFEVGSFAPIAGSAFGIFTLSEHLVFAVQILPIALVAMTAISALYLNYRPSRRAPKWVHVLTVPVAACGMVMSFWVFHRDDGVLVFPWVLFGILIVGYAIYTVMRVTEFRFMPKPMAITYLLVAIYAEVFVFALGIFQTQVGVALAPTSTIEAENGTKELVVIRAGQSGVIGFDRSSKRFTFVRKDAIKERSWPKSHFF